MKNMILVICFCLTASTLSAQSAKDDTLRIQNEITPFITKKNSAPMFKPISDTLHIYNGKINNRIEFENGKYYWIKTYPTKELLSKVEVQNILLTSTTITDYDVPEDSIYMFKSEYSFITVEHGVYQEFYLDGILKTNGQYSSGKRIGNWRTYEYGVLIEEVYY